MTKMLRYLLTLGGLAAALIAPVAQAALPNVTAAPPSRNIVATAPATIMFNWRITRTGGNGAVLIEADDGAIRLGSASGTVLETVSTGFTRNFNPPTIPPHYVVTIPETLRISRNLIDQAVAAGKPLVYVREFTDTGYNSTTIGVLTINITGGMGASLSISGMELQFANGGTICTPDRNNTVTAMARLDTEGSGMLRGAWKIREGGPYGVFRTLQLVRMPVHAGQNLRLESPALPIGNNGRFDVMFDIEDPVPGFTEPTITCAAFGDLGARQNRHDPRPRAELLTPAGAQPLPLNGETSLSWKAVDKARAYRIEIMAEAETTPVAAQDMPADATTARLSPVVLERLDPARRYYLHVIVLP